MQEKISILLRVVNNYFDRVVNKDTEEIELTSSQCFVLGFLINCDKEEINPRDIEKHCHLKKPTVSGILKRLNEKGFIRVENSNKDNRYKQIILTEKAIKHKEEMDRKISYAENILCAGFTEEERVVIENALVKMFENLNKHIEKQL